MSKNDIWAIDNSLSQETDEVYMSRSLSISVFALLVFSSSLISASEETPSWVLGLRNGSEGIKLVSGNKIFYRRLMSDTDGDKNLTCQKAVEAAEESLKAEIFSDVKIPYTLEIIFYDPKVKDCAVTISILSSLMDKLIEINEYKKNEKGKRDEIEESLKQAKLEKKEAENKLNELNRIVKDNYEVFSKYNRLKSDYDEAKSIATNRYEKAKMFAITGLRKKEFEAKIGEKVEINFDYDGICNRLYKRVHSSNHAGLNVCWTDMYGLPEIVMYCHEGACWVK